MDRAKFMMLLSRIYHTQEEEIDCATLYETIAQFVDLELSGEDAALLLPLVHQHLDQCPNCHELYEALRLIAQMDAESKLAEVEPTPEWLFSQDGPTQ